MKKLPIGIFDSGVGGLTVLEALQEKCPNESFLYLGDMARLPYGTKNPETVINYSLQVCDHLLERGIKMLVVACNTASALALPTLQKQIPDIPIVGVLNPGARTACEASKSGHIAVIATEATVNSNSYTDAISKIRSDANVIAASCSMFVALVEEGWITGDITSAVIRQYLDPLLDKPIDTLVLGCTHFPALNKAIRENIPEHVNIVNSASSTADEVQKILIDNDLYAQDIGNKPTVNFLVTDSPNRFLKISKHLLPYELQQEHIELIDLHRK